MSSLPFYDAHCHALTLSHPCFLSYIEAARERRLETLYAQMSSPNYLLASVLTKGGERIRNILSVMENDVGSIFALMEDDLRGLYAKPGDPPPLLREGELRLGRLRFDRLVLLPLIMDFEEKVAHEADCYYDRPPAKPVSAQVREVLLGIKDYRVNRPEGFLEIRPFLGLNPANHSLDSLSLLLDRGFRGFSRDREASRRSFLAMRNLRLEKESGFRFAGIKLYPPLGFQPWPEAGPEREKAELLYGFCERAGIPLTTHCDDQGFRTIPLEASWEASSPFTWGKALKVFPRLRLNFAHFGMQYSRGIGRPAPTDWAGEILRLMGEYPQVFTDLSFNGSEPEYYAALSAFLERQDPGLAQLARNRILFGSDFPVNLSKIRSYSDYYRYFADSPLTDEEKRRFGQDNPERFLYGE